MTVVLAAAALLVSTPSVVVMTSSRGVPEIAVTGEQPNPDRADRIPGAIELPSTATPVPPQPRVPSKATAKMAPSGDSEPSSVPGSTDHKQVIARADAGRPWNTEQLRDFLQRNGTARSSDVIASIVQPRAAPPVALDLPSPTAAPPPLPPVAAAPSPTAPSDDAACRAKERSLGINNSGPCVDITAMVENLARGEYRFNKPKSAFLGEPFRLTLVLRTTSQQDVTDRFEGTAGEVVQREGKFAQSLEATLRADDFKIEPPGPQARTATMAAPVEWSWLLTPQSEGEKRLVIEVAANLLVGTAKHPVQVTTLREAVVIQVGLLQRVKLYVAEFNSWVVALTGLAGALGSLLAFVPAVRRFVVGLFRRRDPAQPAN